MARYCKGAQPLGWSHCWPGGLQGGCEASRIAKAGAQRFRERLCLGVRGKTKVKRKYRRCGKPIALPAFSPQIILEQSGLGIPHEMLDCADPSKSPETKLLRADWIPFHFVGFRQDQLHVSHQAVEVDRRNLRCLNRPEMPCVFEPARTKIPARFRTGAKIAIDLGLGLLACLAVSKSSR